jgi:hypothetical protein
MSTTLTNNNEEIVEESEPSKLALLFTAQWREIFETHVLTKLRPRSEIKFLKMAFKNARDAVRRAGIEVGKKINISEFTSLSQMEFAWDNYRWDEDGYKGTQELFCERVAQMNKLEYLVWAREVKNCDWGRWTINWAAIQGNLAMVEYCVENECPMDAYTCALAASEGHLDVLKYLHENDSPWNFMACFYAYWNNRIECLNYLIHHKCPGWRKFDRDHPNFNPNFVYLTLNEEDEEDEEDSYDW